MESSIKNTQKYYNFNKICNEILFKLPKAILYCSKFSKIFTNILEY